MEIEKKPELSKEEARIKGLELQAEIRKKEEEKKK